MEDNTTGLARAELWLNAFVQKAPAFRTATDDTDDVSQQKTRKENQSACAETQLTTNRARPHCPNRNHCKRKADSHGRSSTNQRSDECDCHRHRMPTPHHSSFLRINCNTRKVLPSGTRCYLPPVLRGAHNGTWVRNSMSLHENLSIHYRTFDGFRRFQVEEDSNLYYDPSPLLEYQKEDKQVAPNAIEGIPSSSSHHLPSGSQRGQPYPMAGHHSVNGVAMSPVVATPTRHGVPMQMGGPYPGGPQFHAIPPNQFYGGGDRGSPMVTRGMGVGMGMGMGMEGMGITPDVRSLSRRV